MAVEIFDIEAELSSTGTLARDILQIDELWQQISAGTPSARQPDPETLQTMMSGLDHLVIRDDEQQARIIGAVSLMSCTDRLVKIDLLAVTPAMHRQGFGHELVVGAVDYCAKKGCNQIMTTAMPSSEPLFASAGFKPFDYHKSGNVTMFMDLLVTE